MNLYSRCSSATNKEGNQFVGVRYDGDVEIKFPIGYRIPTDEKELRKEILLLIRSFNLTKSVNKNSMNNGTYYKEEFKFPIYSYFWLIKDFIDKGLYKIREKEITQKATGKINWKKTIQKTHPLIANDGFVYFEPYFEKSRNTDTLITEIEKYCLNLANDFFGWLFGEIKVPKSIFNDRKINYMKCILQKELVVSFSDYKKSLLTHMLNILTGLDDDIQNSKIYSYGTENYDVVWEKLVFEVFGNVRHIEEYYPLASWNLSKLNLGNKELSPLRQDAIYADKNTGKYYILDAKYYRTSQNKDLSGLPSSSDIEKQITYGQELVNNKGIDPQNVYNALILPFNMNKNHFKLKENIEYIGNANPSWVEKKYPYQNVELLFVDTRYLLNRWKKNNELDIDNMIKIIEKNI